MCGIWGQIVNDIPEQLSSYVAINTKQAYEACKTVQKRGPERTNIKETSNYFLAFHRLAINGLDESNDQPYVHIHPSNDTHKVIIMCNGEIYNFHELNKELGTNTNCDTQIIWELYKDCDYNFHTLNQRLKGEYALAICIVDAQTSKPYRAFFSVDPCSVRPLFYSIDHSTPNSPLSVTFSSLLAGVKHTQHPQRLHGGQMLTVDFHAEKVHTDYYWDWNATPPSLAEEDTNLLDIQFRLVYTLEACVKRRLTSDREIGCFLSGGLDSSIVAAIVAQNLAKIGKQLRTFSIGAPDSQDVKHAEIVAKHINSIHTNVPFRIEEGLTSLHDVMEATETFDITTIRASVGQFLISKYIREHTDIKVVFSGDGADEAEMGYLYFYNAPSDEAAQEESVKLLREIHLYDGLRVDRCVSWHGLEARVPYLDEDFVSLMISIPAHLKRPIRDADAKGKEEKALLRHAFAKYRPSLLPSSVLFRTKETFSDSLSTETSDWYTKLKIFTLKGISLLGGRSNTFYLPPPSPEVAYYRYFFREIFGEHCAQVIPHFWMPLWVKHTKGDPSAKQMDVYNEIAK